MIETRTPDHCPWLCRLTGALDTVAGIRAPHGIVVASAALDGCGHGRPGVSGAKLVGDETGSHEHAGVVTTAIVISARRCE